jgi:hypothetical protein
MRMGFPGDPGCLDPAYLQKLPLASAGGRLAKRPPETGTKKMGRQLRIRKAEILPPRDSCYSIVSGNPSTSTSAKCTPPLTLRRLS